MRNLAPDGTIAEPTSANYGKLPDPDVKREKQLIRRIRWNRFIPIMGVFSMAIDGQELTDRWGHYPWWL